MDIQLTGTGGPDGWPGPGCGCAPCARMRRRGIRRLPSAVLLDGALRLPPGTGEPHGPGEPATEAGDPGGGTGDPGTGEPGPGTGELTTGVGYRVQRLPGGWDVTAPDGSRLLLVAGPGAGPGTGPEPAEGTGPYQAALLDLIGDPSQLGLLRRRGLVTGETLVAPVHIDHRVRSEEELARRCALWGVPVLEDGSRVTVAPGGMPRFAGPAPAREYPLTPAGPARGPWRVLLLGGARSGKSAEAELRLAAEPEVTYVATGPGPGTDQDQPDQDRPDQDQPDQDRADQDGPDQDQLKRDQLKRDQLKRDRPDRDWADRDWADRVAAHRARRPRWWRTAETLDLAGRLRAASGALLVDGIGTWLAGTMDECGVWDALKDGPAGAAPGPATAAPGPPAGHRPAGHRPASHCLAERIADLLDAWRHTRAHVVAVSDETGSGVVPATASGRRFRDELGRLNQLLAADSDEAALVVAGRVLPLPA
jgi:adenosylcobinamide kinase / adenosylcobinamide-phosphate guanylyltransferase